MASQRATSDESRTPLSKERVLQTAIELADKGGVDALSMRKLGQALGVEAMSLYNHVANKDDLLDGMVDIVFGEIGLPPVDEDWKTAMRARAISARDVLSRHPWAIAFMESRRRPGPATLQAHEAMLGCLREAGFSLVMTAHAASLMDSYIYGFAQQQASLPFDDGDGAAAVAENIFQEFAVNAYPYLTEIAMNHVMQPGYSYANEFNFGLDLILDGLERMRATT